MIETSHTGSLEWLELFIMKNKAERSVFYMIMTILVSTTNFELVWQRLVQSSSNCKHGGKCLTFAVVLILIGCIKLINTNTCADCLPQEYKYRFICLMISFQLNAYFLI